MLIDQRIQRIRSIRKTTEFRSPNSPVWRSCVTEYKRNRVRRDEQHPGTHGSVVSHFIRHVLPASKTLGVDTDLDEERVDSSQEVSQSFVVNGSLGAQKVGACFQTYSGRQAILTLETASPMDIWLSVVSPPS